MPIAFTSDTAGTYSSGDPFTLVWTVEALTHAPPLPAGECLRQMAMGRIDAIFDVETENLTPNFVDPRTNSYPYTSPYTIDTPFENGRDPFARQRLRRLYQCLFTSAQINPLSLFYFDDSGFPENPELDEDGIYWVDQYTPRYSLASLLAAAGHSALLPFNVTAPVAVQLHDCLQALRWCLVAADSSQDIIGLREYTAEP